MSQSLAADLTVNIRRLVVDLDGTLIRSDLLVETSVGFIGRFPLSANILAQEASVVAYRGENWLAVSIVVGAAVGFVVKYLLDKHYIFFDRMSDYSAELWKVVLYGLSGVLTTLVFWIIEIGFWHAWGTDFAKYTGADLGLAIGYIIKYFLDSRFVFVGCASEQPTLSSPSVRRCKTMLTRSPSIGQPILTGCSGLTFIGTM